MTMTSPPHPAAYDGRPAIPLVILSLRRISQPVASSARETRQSTPSPASFRSTSRICPPLHRNGDDVGAADVRAAQRVGAADVRAAQRLGVGLPAAIP